MVVKLRKAGRPRRLSPKAKRVWVGQHDMDKIDAVLSILNPGERWAALERAAREKEGYWDDDDYQARNDVYPVPPSEYESHAPTRMTVERILSAVGNLPVRIVEQIAESACFKDAHGEFEHICDERGATWRVVYAALGAIVELNMWPDGYNVAWMLGLRAWSGRTVTSYQSPHGDIIITCSLDDLTRSLGQVGSLRISEQSMERVKEANRATGTV